ncbi:hypothetical protein V491_04728 [Pseudogymnoascus sp. VKM F-3775]|nr:hypothetical protein V491_04728 [Pseudogymnoascus sp. VKM F-3775]
MIALPPYRNPSIQSPHATVTVPKLPSTDNPKHTPAPPHGSAASRPDVAPIPTEASKHKQWPDDRAQISVFTTSVALAADKGITKLAPATC